MKSKYIIIFSLTMITLVFYFALNIQQTYGHTEIQVGNYTIEAGWEEEPPLINNLNNVLLGIYENDEPVRNAMRDLAVSINYGGVDKELNFIPSEQSAGVYLANIIPSQLGSYSVTLTGAIGTQIINNTIPIEDVEDTNRLTFPLVTGDSNTDIQNIGRQITPIIRDLSNQIDESTQQINSTNEILQQINEENNSLRSEIERTNMLSYIATGLSASAIIIVGFMQRINRK